MADTPSKDPAAVWRDLVSQWEKNVNSLANSSMASDEFSGSANTAMNAALKVQQATGTVMATYLATLNLPSRADITALGERLAAMESYLSRIASALEAGGPELHAKDKRAKEKHGKRKHAASETPDLSAAVRPPRTRRPPE